MGASVVAWRVWWLTFRHEVREQARMMALVGGVFAAIALAMGQPHGASPPPRSAWLVAFVPTFACAAIPASVVDHAASGFVRLVRTQPAHPGAYVAMRIASVAGMLLAGLAPLVVLLAALEGAAIVPALVTLALVALWSAALAVLLGLAMRGPGAATGVWVLVATFNLLAVLATAPGMRMDDLLVRARHALPGPSVIEALARGYDPWLLTSLTILALQALLIGALAIFRAPRVALVGALVLPFLLPAAGASR